MNGTSTIQSGHSSPLTSILSATSSSVNNTLSLNNSNHYLLDFPPHMQALLQSTPEPIIPIQSDQPHTSSIHISSTFSGGGNRLASKFRKW
jgi:hypothetical protein